MSPIEKIAEQDHWSECGRVTPVADPDALGRPHRSVLLLGITSHAMKTSHLTCLGICILLVAGCASPSRTKLPHANPSAPVVSASADLLVISAAYGSGTSYADVTYRVNDMVHQPTVEFFARPEWLRADPTPGWNKALVIVYEFKGQRRIFTCGEGGRVSAEILIQEATK